MNIQITIPLKRLYFTDEQLLDWKAGRKGNCTDSYCNKLQGSYGFGEYLIGSYFEEQGYKWIHHDFNVFGGNKPGKYHKPLQRTCRFP